MATNDVYINPGTVATWAKSGGDHALTLTGLAADAVRVGARRDLGSAARPFLYEWRFKSDGFDSAPVVGATIDVYLSTSDGTDEDGKVGTADAGGAKVSLPNLKYLGSATVRTTTAGDDSVASGVIEIYARYCSPVIHNRTSVAMLSTADAHTFKLTAVPYQPQ